MKSKDYFKEEWSNVFQLCSESPSGLSWKSGNVPALIGKPVGGVCSTGHWKCEYNGKSISVHRVVYFLSCGTLDPEKVVDHINGNPADNSLSNLRLVDRKNQF